SGPASPATIPPEFEHVQKLRARTGSVLLKTFDTERIGVTFPPPAPARPARPRLRALCRASGYRPGHGSVSDPARVRGRPAWPGRVAARRLVGMSALLERLLPLWTQPVDARDDPEAAFGQVYADPVVVNGTPMSLTELAGRARSLQQAFDDLGMDI